MAIMLMGLLCHIFTDMTNSLLLESEMNNWSFKLKNRKYISNHLTSHIWYFFSIGRYMYNHLGSLRSEIETRKGTYILILRALKKSRVVVGRLGSFDFVPGFYIYVGSALGSGGIRARLGHHLKLSKHPRWHIDFLRQVAHVVEIYYNSQPHKLEHTWAASLFVNPSFIPYVHGFGSSDCQCDTHLFHSKSLPTFYESEIIGTSNIRRFRIRKYEKTSNFLIKD